jgi:hypothetical protein
MRKIAYFIFTMLFLVGAGNAAEFQGDHLFACGKSWDISPGLQPSALALVSLDDMSAKHFDLVYKRYTQLFEATLSATEKSNAEVSRFVASLPRADSFEVKDFDVSHEAGQKAEVFLKGTDKEIFMKCDKLPPYFVNMASVSLMTRWVRSQEILPELEKRASFVAHQSKVHEALLYNGLPMWPWELWLNGKRLGKDDWEPLFKTQWILMRPTAGVGISTQNGFSENLNVSVGVEPLGFVNYRDDDYKTWWGASLLLTSSTNAGSGLGGLLRWNHYVLGVTHHTSAAAGIPDDNFVFVGVELFDLFNKKKRDDFSEWQQLQKNRLSEILH